MKTQRTFYTERDRYHYDFGVCSREKGWKQYDTDQDAWYFGVWVHPELLEIVTYAEGDEIRQICESKEELKAELERMAGCYGNPPPSFTSINQDGSVTQYYDERPTI